MIMDINANESHLQTRKDVIMLELILDALLDTAKLLPFLYLTYLAMEYLEHRLEGKSSAVMEKAGRFGPLYGGLLGVVPQCGFSAAASNLYAGRVVTLGTLLAIFLSTSDEMLPIMISRQTPLATVLKIIGLKALIAVAVGFAVDLLMRRSGNESPKDGAAIQSICHDEHCHCEQGNIFLSALRHTVSIALFIALFSFLINLALYALGEGALMSLLRTKPVLSVFLSALVGLIPNCAASVAITTLYLDGLLGFGAMMAGLLVSAGVGLLVLFRMNRNARENLTIVFLLYGIGVLFGGLLEWLSVAV